MTLTSGSRSSSRPCSWSIAALPFISPRISAAASLASTERAEEIHSCTNLSLVWSRSALSMRRVRHDLGRFTGRPIITSLFVVHGIDRIFGRDADAPFHVQAAQPFQRGSGRRIWGTPFSKQLAHGDAHAPTRVG